MKHKISAITIYETTDYTIFKRMNGNRTVTDDRVHKICKSMIDRGVLFCPLLVNENLEIIDGQGRLEALEKLHETVRYIVQPGLKWEDCVALNISQTSWTINDYIDSWASRGIADYILLRRLANEFKDFNISIVAQIANDQHGGAAQKIKNGSFRLTDERYEECRKDLEWLRSLDLPAYKQNLVLALLFCKGVNGCKADRLKKKVGEHYKEIAAQAKVADICKAIEDRYNAGMKEEYRVDLKEKYRVFCKKANVSWATRFGEGDDTDTDEQEAET